MKHLVELSNDDLETLRLMSKRFPKRWRNAETPEELLDKIGAGICEKFDEDMAEEESKLPILGIKIVVGTILGIFMLVLVVGSVWRLLTQ